MKESVYYFGEGNNLSGVITKADALSHLPAVILLNSGLIPRIGPNRVYVKIARRLAQKGFPVLRFDFSGVGDSVIRPDHLSFALSSVAECRAAMDFLVEKTGARQFILSGICSGADAAFDTALADPQRVSGVIPIDFYSVSSHAYQAQMYKQRLRSLSSWAKLFSGKSDLYQRVFSEKEKDAETVFQGPATENVSQKKRETIISEMQGLLRQAVRVLLIYSAESAANFNYENSLKSSLGSLQTPNGNLQVSQLAADHGFTPLSIQQELLDTMEKWLCEHFR